MGRVDGCDTPLERHPDTKPELHRSRAIDRLGHIKSERGTFDEAEPGEIDAEAGADSVRHRPQGMAPNIRIPDVIKSCQRNVSHADYMIATIPGHMLDHRHAPFQAADPDQASLAF